MTTYLQVLLVGIASGMSAGLLFAAMLINSQRKYRAELAAEAAPKPEPLDAFLGLINSSQGVVGVRPVDIGAWRVTECAVKEGPSLHSVSLDLTPEAERILKQQS